MNSLFRIITILLLSVISQYAFSDDLNIQSFAKQFIKAEFDAWRSGKFDALEALEDPNIVFHNTADGSILVNGWEEHKQYIIKSRQAPDLKQEFNYITGDGNLFVLDYKASGKSPDQSEFNIAVRMVFLLKNGKVIEVWL